MQQLLVATSLGFCVLLSGCAAQANPSEISSIHRSGRTLLTHAPQAVTAAAAETGVLSVNAAGCLTAGGHVLILTDTARLNSDGSIDYDGRHYQQGRSTALGGGSVPAPKNSTCGRSETYWYG